MTYQSAIIAETINEFLLHVNDIPNLSKEKKKLLVLIALKQIPYLLEKIPLQKHGDFNAGNVLIGKDFDEYTIDIGELKKMFSSKEEDIKYFFHSLKNDNNRVKIEKGQDPLNDILETDELDVEKVESMLEGIKRKHNWVEKNIQNLQSDLAKEYYLKKLGYLINKATGQTIDFKVQELEEFAQKIEDLYKIDKSGKGAPAVLMPYADKQEKKTLSDHIGDIAVYVDNLFRIS